MFLLNVRQLMLEPEDPGKCLVPEPHNEEAETSESSSLPKRCRDRTRIQEFKLSSESLFLHPADSFQGYKQAFEYKQL